MLKYSIKFSIKGNTDDKPVPIRVRVSFNSVRVELYSKISVEPSRWDPEKSRTTVRNDRRNIALVKIESNIEAIFQKHEVLHGRFPTIQEFKDLWAEKSGKVAVDNNPTLTYVFDLFIEEMGTKRQWSSGTHKAYQSIRNHWELYAKKLKINELTEATLIGFIRYFHTAPIDVRTKKRKAPHRNSTVARNIRDFKGMLSWAHKKKIYTGDLHETFEYTFKGASGDLKEIVYLEWSELNALFNHDFGSLKLNQVRDVFCFCCFTGLRFSDVKKLAHHDIRDGFLVVTTKKTLDPLRIELNDYSREILSRYTDYPQPLPVISLDKTNEYLKEIGEIMEWNDPVSEVYFIGEKRFTRTYQKKEVISTHAGRRTFVVNALKMGIPSIVIRSWTGHKDEQAMRPYTKIVDDLKAEHMNKFNKLPPVTPENTPENDSNNSEN